MVEQAPTRSITFVDNPHAPEVFAFQVSGVAFFGGNIHLTFEAPRINHIKSPGPLNRVVVGRLVMPFAGAEGLRDLLADYLPKVKAGETAPQAPPDGSSVH
jgi:hypothetical protein